MQFSYVSSGTGEDIVVETERVSQPNKHTLVKTFSKEASVRKAKVKKMFKKSIGVRKWRSKILKVLIHSENYTGSLLQHGHQEKVKIGPVIYTVKNFKCQSFRLNYLPII